MPTLTDYLAVTESHRAALRRHGITGAASFFRAIAAFASAVKHDVCPEAAPGCLSVYRRHAVCFLRSALLNAHFDMFKMARDGHLCFGGSYPNQWISLNIARTAHIVLELPPPADDFVLQFNGGLLEEDALWQALSASCAVKVPPDEEEEVLTCPITLERFKDPVCVASGRTYERRAIEAWLSKSSSDPLTGEPLRTTAVTVDRRMQEALKRSRVD